MHIFFSGIGGTGIGPLAMVAKQAGYEVSGSDKQQSNYIEYLQKQGIENIHIGQEYSVIEAVHRARPIDWYVYSSAVQIEQQAPPEFRFCEDAGIHMSKRDELLNKILQEQQLKLVAVAGTHGKTTTTAMAVWLAKQLSMPIGYILPAKSSFADMGALEPGAEYFIYECDEFDRNFLHFEPYMSMITGIDWDHPDIYPTRENYYQAFQQFLMQSKKSAVWQSDVDRLKGQPSTEDTVLSDEAPEIDTLKLAGHVNRRNAWQVASVFSAITDKSVGELITLLEAFPGVARRFELLSPGLYSDYAHTPRKIEGALQLGHEVAGNNLVVVYEGLHNTRQHFIKDELNTLFDEVKKLYIVPSYRAREDESLEDLTPEKLALLLSSKAGAIAVPSLLDATLKTAISEHLAAGDTVLCLTAGGGGSLDEWLRRSFTK